MARASILTAFVISAGIMSGCSKESASGPVRLTLGDAYDTFVRYSPTGEHIAFTRRRGDVHSSSAVLVVMRSDGSSMRELTSGDDWDHGGAWSPDGTRLAYSSDRSGSKDIWTINLSTGEQRQLTALRGNEEQPDWAPGGATIAFHSDEAGNYDIWTVDVASEVVTQLTDAPVGDFSPRYSPDGLQIAFRAERYANNTDLFVMPAAGERASGVAARRLTTNEGNDYNPAWFPDGRRIAYTSSARTPTLALWSVSVDRMQYSQLTPEIEGVGMAAPSPDGRTLAYQVYKRQEFIFRTDVLTGETEQLTTGGAETSPTLSLNGDLAYVSGGRIWVVRGGAIARLTTGDVLEADPAWSPDGGEIAFITSAREGANALVIMEGGGGSPRTIVRAHGLSRPTWCGDGDLLLTGLDANGVPQAWHVALESSKLRRLTGGEQHTVSDCSTERGAALVTRGATVNPDVYSVSLAGAPPVLVIEDASDARYAQDGRIAFLSNRRGDLEVFVQTETGIDRVTNSPWNEARISWLGAATVLYSLNVGHSHIWVRPLELSPQERRERPRP